MSLRLSIRLIKACDEGHLLRREVVLPQEERVRLRTTRRALDLLHDVDDVYEVVSIYVWRKNHFWALVADM